MLNEKGLRELCYVVKVDNIEPIEGKDRVEAAVVGGWKIMVKKGEFHPGSLGIYFEIDSQVPAEEPFLFLAPKHFKIKTQKYGNFYSQGLLMPPEDFGWTVVEDAIVTKKDKYQVGDFLTSVLGVTYASADDRKRKGSDKLDKYQKMKLAHSALFKKKFFKWGYEHNLTKKIFYLFLRPKKKADKDFPTRFPYIKVTDEERVENMPYILEADAAWVKTTKIDGTSSTYIMERKGKKFKFYVYSRHVRQFNESQECYHNTNVYWEMAKKYKIEEFLKNYLIENPTVTYVCLQGETAGVDVQGNPHKFPDRRFFGFNLIDSEVGRFDTLLAAATAKAAGIPWVPIVDTLYIPPKDMEEFKLSADGPCEAEGASGLREGYVYRNIEDPNISFKNVSRKYLMKKH